MQGLAGLGELFDTRSAGLGSALPCSEAWTRAGGWHRDAHETRSGNGHHGAGGDADRLRGEHDRDQAVAGGLHRRRVLRRRGPRRAGGRGAPDLCPGARPQRGLGGPADRPILESRARRRGPRSARGPGGAGSAAQAPDHAHRRDRGRPDAGPDRVHTGLRAGQRHHPLRRAGRRTLRPGRQRGSCLRGARAEPHRGDRELRSRSGLRRSVAATRFPSGPATISLTPPRLSSSLAAPPRPTPA